MIQDVDETLRRLLTRELMRPELEAGLGAVEVTFDLPPVAAAPTERSGDSNGHNTAKMAGPGGKTRVNLYLHDVRENLQLRDESFTLNRRPQEGVAGKRRPPVRMDLSYILTTHSSTPLLEHQWLAEALRVFLLHSSVPVTDYAGSLEGRPANAVTVQVAQPEHPAHAQPAQLWQSMGGMLRPSLGLKVTAPFDPFETEWTRIVREVLLSVGQGTSTTQSVEAVSVRASIAGVVFDAKKNTPLVDVEVRLAGREHRVRSDARGVFAFLNLAPGKYAITLEKRGYAPLDVEVTAPPPARADLLEPQVLALQPVFGNADSGGENVAAGAAESALVEVERQARQHVQGCLRFPSGKPAAFIAVRAGENRTVTDAGGYYSFFSLPSGDVRLIAEVPGRGEIELALTPGATTTGPPNGHSQEVPALPVVETYKDPEVFTGAAAEPEPEKAATRKGGKAAEVKS